MTFRIVLTIVMVACIGCQSATRDPVQPSNLTAGMAKKTIRPGTTTQAEITEVFGPPNLVTYKNGREMWTYDKIRQEIQRSDGYFTVLLAGTSSSTQKSSEVSMMLIVYFDENDVVQDYKMNVSKF